MLLLFWAPSASAQDLPALDAQRFRPSVDAQATLWTDDAGSITGRETTFGALVGYTRNPLLFEDAEGNTLTAIGNLSLLDLTASTRYRRARIGLRLPVGVVGESDLGGGGGGIGDVGLDGRFTLSDGPVGFAVRAGLGLPTSTLGVGLASEGPTWDTGLIASADVGEALITANLGYQGVPGADVVAGDWDDQIYGRIGLGLRVSEQAGVSAEVSGARTLAEAGEGATGTPIELLLGGWVAPTDVLSVRMGVGTGLTDGIGAPDLRALIGASWQWGEQPVPAPEPLGVAVQFRVTDPEGGSVKRARVVAAGMGISAETNGTGTATLPAGAYQLTVSAEGYTDVVREILVPDGPQWQADVTMEPVAVMGAVRIQVTAPDGSPVEATWQLEGRRQQAAVAAGDEIPLPPGEHTIIIRSGDLAPTRTMVSVEAGGVSDLVVALQERLVEVTAEQIVIREKVFFETGMSTIRPESYALLDQVAQVLRDHEELTKVRVEGHTDSRGSDAANLTLSDSRAAAVRDYLLSQGIAADRMDSVGYGEERPLVEGSSERAWAANRRVEFFILEREAP